MLRPLLSSLLVLSMLPALGGCECSGNGGATADTGPMPPDAGTDAGEKDAGALDAGEGMDAGAEDAGAPPDAAGPGDAGVTPSTLAGGNLHTCTITATGDVACWGDNRKGQLGDGTTTDRHTPVTVGVTGGVALAAGRDHTCVALATGAIECWGDNGAGQLGDGTTTGRTSPVAVEGLTNAVEVVSHWSHTCARLSTGAVHCWGAGDGRLGDGTATSRSTPGPVSGIDDAVSIGAGWGHTCAVLSDGTGKCTGTYNNWGQLGDGTTMDTTTPVDVVGLTNAVQITTGSYHTCARVWGDTAKCWGNNQGGSIGIGSMGDTPVPTPRDVPALSGVVEISAGGSAHSCARLADGTVWCWGGGHLGNGSPDGSTTPVQTTGISNAVAIEAGGNHSCAALATGELRCWGNNSRGGLGDGTTSDRLTPVAVDGFP